MNNRPTQKRPFQFTLLSLMIVMTLASFGFSWLKARPPKRTPLLFQQKQFNAAVLTNAVNYFVDRGEAETIRELTAIADVTIEERQENFKNGFNVSERVGWVCRILWQNESVPLRPPRLGRLRGLPYYRSTTLAIWPMYPVAKSGDTYFILSQGYEIWGREEWMPRYLDYCRQNGTFRKSRICVPTETQAVFDLQRLLQSTRWEAEFPAGCPEPFFVPLLEQTDPVRYPDQQRRWE